MKPPNKLFFSSLKRLEKRLKLDDGNPPLPLPLPLPSPSPSPPPPPPETTEPQATDSFSTSPIYFNNQSTNTSSTLHSDSIEQPPQEFLSHNDSEHDSEEHNFPKISTIDDIDSMIQLLKLSDFDGKRAEMADVGEDEFYEKIVKVKGPKCKKEVERLDGWIKYLLNNGRKEPLRLAHLLMAKAAFLSDGKDVEFPSTIDEFLQNDPPLD